MAGTNKKLTATVEAYFKELGRVHASVRFQTRCAESIEVDEVASA